MPIFTITKKYFFFQLSEENVKFIVVSLSVQPVLSLAERYSLTPDETVLKLAGYFKSMGADMVLDMTVAEDLSLIESAKEFVERYKAAKEDSKNQLPMLASSCPGEKIFIAFKSSFYSSYF